MSNISKLNYPEIGKRQKFKRKSKKMTQENLAEKIGVVPSFISEIERGTSIPSLQTISDIANTLDCSLDYLVYGINSKNIDKTFFELLKELPEKDHKFYINICTKISDSFKEGK